jgi:hypothetical protein
MFPAPIVFALALLPEFEPPSVGRDVDFVFEARIKEALAGAPVVIEATLTYLRKRPVDQRLEFPLDNQD